MSNHTGNISTIIKTACMVIAGYAIGYAISIGLNLPITQEQLSETLFMILCFIGAYIDAKYPNTFAFLGNTPSLEEQAQVGEIRQPIILNEEYVEPIPDTEETNYDGC